MLLLLFTDHMRNGILRNEQMRADYFDIIGRRRRRRYIVHLHRVAVYLENGRVATGGWDERWRRRRRLIQLESRRQVFGDLEELATYKNTKLFISVVYRLIYY